MLTAPLTRKQAIDCILASEPEIRALGVQRLSLFGSVVRGEARTNSDVDLLVQFYPGTKNYDRFLALSDLLESRLNRTVDLVTVVALSPFLGPHILAEASAGIGEKPGDHWRSHEEASRFVPGTAPSR